MPFKLTIHYKNHQFQNPYLWIWYDGSTQKKDDLLPAGSDSFGLIYQVTVLRPTFHFKFKEGSGANGPWEPDQFNRDYSPLEQSGNTIIPDEIWCQGDNAFVYHVEPRSSEPESAEAFIKSLIFKSGVYVPGTGGLSALGANLLSDGRMVFGLYHPNAARVYLMGSFNGWQRPGHDQPNPTKFIELKRYNAYFGQPNTWLVVTDQAKVGDEYKFFVQGGVPSDSKKRFQQYFTDPYARSLGNDFKFNNSIIVDPTTFNWTDASWTTPDISQLILYELSVYGFTEGDADIQPSHKGKFKGITERITNGYFDKLGITALALMPLAEISSQEGPTTLGYNPSLFFAVERDFGTPDDLRELVNIAHQHGLPVILDEVFNHTDNDFNPLWKMILEHPKEEGNSEEGGLYFNGKTPWGNRLATEKLDVQYMLIDACKLLMTEYHVDGFRFDATHTNFMDHGFLQHLADELKQFKPNIILIAENLPNQSDLNRQGFDGFAQWCDPFHDKMKALLREGQFQGEFYSTDKLGDIFFFSKSIFASHTNNVVNYSESHDETSISYEVGTNPILNQPATKDRKGRLGIFSALVALGQPMIYMGQEFNVDRDRNIVSFDWPSPPESNGFFQWAYRLIQLRKRYPALKLAGYNPADTGQFTWILGPWFGSNQGGGQKVIGWRSHPNQYAHDSLVIMVNFENHSVTVDVDFRISGTWLKLADINNVNDIPPNGTNSVQHPTAIRSNDGWFGSFTLPSSSGFIYKWETPL